MRCLPDGLAFYGPGSDPRAQWRQSQLQAGVVAQWIADPIFPRYFEIAADRRPPIIYLTSYPGPNVTGQGDAARKVAGMPPHGNSETAHAFGKVDGHGMHAFFAGLVPMKRDPVKCATGTALPANTHR